MVSSSANDDCSCQAAHLDRGILANLCPIPKLAITIISPTPDTPITFNSEGMIAPCSNGCGSDKTAYLNRGEAISSGLPIAKLTIIIISPCPDTAVILQGKGMVVSRGNRYYSTKTADLKRRETVIRFFSIPKLAVLAIAPSPDSSITLYGKGMSVPCSYGHHVTKTADLNRCIPVIIFSPIPKLTILVRPPGPDRPVTL